MVRAGVMELGMRVFACPGFLWPPSAAPSAYPSFSETGRRGYRCWRRTDRLITHYVYDEAERLFGKTATLIPNSPQGPS